MSFLPLLCQLTPESFTITSSSPSLYIFCSHIKAHVLKPCSLASVFLIHAGTPVSVRYSLSAAHHTPRSRLERFVRVLLRDQSAFSLPPPPPRCPVAFAPCSPWVITDWVPATRLGTACLVLSGGCFVLPTGGTRQDSTPVWSPWGMLSLGSRGGLPVGVGVVRRWVCLTCSGIKKPDRMCFVLMRWRFYKFLP